MPAEFANIEPYHTARAPRIWIPVVAGLCSFLLALLVPNRIAGIAFFSATLTLLVIALWSRFFRRSSRSKAGGTPDTVASVIAQDLRPSFVTRADGALIGANPAADGRFATRESATLAAALGGRVTNAAPILFRLQARAEVAGHAEEEVTTAEGALTLAVHRIGAGRYLWRAEDRAPSLPPQGRAETHYLPMLMVGRTGAVLYMNEAARLLIGSRVKTLDRLFPHQPLVPGQVATVTTAEGPQPRLVTECPAGAGRRALYLVPPPREDAGWQALQELPVPMLKIAPDGRVKAFNRMAATLVGASLDKEAHLADLMEGLGRAITDWIEEALADRIVQKFEFLRLKRNDREVFVQVVLNRVVEEGAPALIAVMHDATELKTLEAKFVQSQKMQAIGQLAGGVAHDFNNLLTAISGHCDLLLLRHDRTDPNYADLMQINQNANRAASLVGQLLAFSRKQTLQPQRLDMRDTLADLIHLLNRLVSEKITLTLNHDPILKPIRADKRQLEQVLMNLVVNARDAMPEGGEIRITTECLTLDEPLTRDRVTVPANEYLCLKVIDEGCGIPPDKLEKIFEPFFTTKRTGDGTGLGLSTAYGIVKQTGGFIFVDSMPGSGTTFTLYFPVMAEEPVVAARRVEHVPQMAFDHEDGVILLVEDEAPVRAFASRALRLRGFTVLEAESAEAALKTLEDRSLSVDVFVTDVVMPGMDGPSWVRKALEDRPGVRVVFVSGYAQESFAEDQTRIPNSVFLPKPFSLTDLTETVQRQLQ